MTPLKLMQKRILSGIQPTNHLHLGNYLGAIKQWVQLQEQAECLFCIVDLHAITVRQDPQQLRRSILETAACYLACGIDPQKSVIFVQSAVAAHSELAWVLGCHTPMGWLNRMTQFKDKSASLKQEACLGLYAYPVLMAADILVYQTTHVPVGEDQKQHLELARDIAGAMNRTYQQNLFIEPTPMIGSVGARIMSLRDGLQKMSKSDPQEGSRINLIDDADTINRKIQKAKTDPHPLPANPQELDARPEAKNLISIYALLSGLSLQEVCNQFAGQNFSGFKKALAGQLIASINPIGRKIEAYMQDTSYLQKILSQGAEQAQQYSADTLKKVYQAVGLGF